MQQKNPYHLSPLIVKAGPEGDLGVEKAPGPGVSESREDEKRGALPMGCLGLEAFTAAKPGRYRGASEPVVAPEVGSLEACPITVRAACG